jgi:hypothetical protein
MSNVDVNDRSDRRSALDDFASAPAREVVAAPSVQPMVSPGDRVFGAQQVAVYRDEARIFQKLAALGAAAGDDWFYRFPVKKKIKNEETGKDEWVKDWIEGSSIKLANDVARIYGNCEVDTRVYDQGASWLIYARFTDFETGYALTRPFQQNKGASRMGSDNDRKLDIAFQIGVSKAIRNVVVNALQTYSDFAFDAARNSLVERIGKNLAGYRDRTIQGIGNLGVELSRVELAIGRAAKDWLAPDIAKVIAMMKAIADGMATIDETFPPRDKQIAEQTDPETGEVTKQTNTAASAATGEKTGDATDAGSATSPAGPASNRTGSTPPRDATASAASGQAAPESSDPSKAKDKGAAAAGDGKAATPKNEAEYVAYAEAWIDALTDVEGEKRWPAEKNLRNKANVGGDAREALQSRLAKKIADIKDADRS